MVKLEVLTNNEIQEIHDATLVILSETGVVVNLPRGRDLLLSAGAKVQKGRVTFPPDLVESCLKKCSTTLSIKGRNNQTITLGEGGLHWHNLGGARDIFDPDTNKRKPAGVKEVADSTRLLDALDNVSTITPLFTPQDVPGELMSLAMYHHTLPHTTKPVHGPGVQTSTEVSYAIRMAAVIGNPQEVLSLGISPVSPLTFPDDVVDAILHTAEAGIPFGPLPCPIAGASAPLTIAGAVAQQNAEVLASIVIAQLVHPGLPIVYCGRLAMMEPRTGISVWGGIELGLASAATVQVGHHYNLPVNVYGLSTNSHIPDLQNGYERAINALVPALAGADELSGIGETEAGTLSSYTQIVIDNEIAGSVNRLVRGFVTDEETLATQVIASVMDGSRNFLGQKHTVKYLRAGEIMLTRLAERGSWEEWDRSGRRGMAENAHSLATQILAEHEVPPLEDEQIRQLDEIMSHAEKELVK